MREVALYDAKNNLSALIAEIEASGEEIVITRHGAPAARLGPVVRAATPAERGELLARLAANRDAWAAAHPKAVQPVPWETVKAWMDEER
ncbi:MAG: type II toxin-antitoxin system Phd/YefM family antitoxin [Caulobacterales bacterium]|jgi:prevent-host-death family protein